MTKKTTSRAPTKKHPSDLLMEQRLTYGDFVTARRHAALKTASPQEKMAYQVMRQRRHQRALELRAAFVVVKDG